MTNEEAIALLSEWTEKRVFYSLEHKESIEKRVFYSLEHKESIVKAVNLAIEALRKMDLIKFNVYALNELLREADNE